MRLIMTHVIRPRKTYHKPATIIRVLQRKAMRKLNRAISSISFHKRVQKMQTELRLLTTYSSDSVYRLRYDSMNYEYVSPAITSLLGYTPAEMRTINFRSLILETKLITNGIKTVFSFEELEENRKNNDVHKWQADYLMLTKHGEKRWVSDISYPWFDKKGKIIGSVGSLRDVTDRVNAERIRNEELVRLAHTDPLTNLANRREFFNRTEIELTRIQRTHNDLSILLIDIDHFKMINDSYGHDVGDKVLIEMAKIFKSCLRQTDLVARLGGEEFGVILPDTSSSGAFWVAERVRQTIAKHAFYVLPDGLPLSCTVSVGISSSSLSERGDVAGLYKVADTRLYIAKNTGRNQVSVDEIVQLH
jgi:diguanylate cyclase (GGDEF)-like protein/PAS domain S-box-containing protein